MRFRDIRESRATMSGTKKRFASVEDEVAQKADDMAELLRRHDKKLLRDYMKAHNAFFKELERISKQIQ